MVSFIIPVFNSEKYIEACIQSVIDQTYSNWELILVNDGSKDRSEDICVQYAKKEKRIKYLKKENGGVSSARNYGIDHAKGKYITFIDSDDFIDKHYVEIMLERVENSDTKMVVFGMRKYYEDGLSNPISYRIQSGYYTYKDLKGIVIDDGTLSGFTFHSSCSILFELKVIKENNIRFKENIRFNEDGLFSTQYFLCLKDSQIYVDFSYGLYYYRANPDSATSTQNVEKYREDMQSIEMFLNNMKEPEIKKQISKRRVSVAIDTLLTLSKQKKLSYKYLKETLKDQGVKEGVLTLSVDEQKSTKKVLVCAMKLKLYYLVYLILKIRTLY